MKLTDEQRAQRNRLKSWMKAQGIDRQELAEKTGFKKKYLDQVLSGGNAVSKSLVYEVSKNYKGVNGEWILRGVGTMYTTVNGEKTIAVEESEVKYEARPVDPLGALRELLERHEERIGELEKQVRWLRGGDDET